MANVFGNGSNRNCSSGSGILPAPRPSVIPARPVASTPNVFKGEGATPDQLNPRDFYTRREVDRYLSDKADLSDVYTQEKSYSSIEVDQLLAQLNLSSYASIAYVDSSISSYVNSINANLNSNYYDKTQTYSKSEVNNLVSTADLGDNYVSKAPNSLADITINPGIDTLSVSLIVRSSNNTATTQAQRWENSATDLLAAIYADGKATFTNLTTVGENVSAGEVALYTSERRIAGVANPVNNLDAVNKSYMETFITTTIDDVLTDTDENYLVDALEY
jgi:hypothetical protein